MIATWGDLWNTCGVLAAIGTTLIPSPSPLEWRVLGSTKYVLQDPYIYCNKICPFPGTTGQVGQKPAVLVYGNVVLGWLWLRSLINDWWLSAVSLLVFPSILQCLQTEFFQQKLVCFAAINLELTNNRCLHRKSWELYEADPRDAALGSVFLEATFNPKSNILGLISGNVC